MGSARINNKTKLYVRVTTRGWKIIYRKEPFLDPVIAAEAEQDEKEQAPFFNYDKICSGCWIVDYHVEYNWDKKGRKFVRKSWVTNFRVLTT